MNEQRMEKILHHLSTTTFITSQTLAEYADVSSRTIRSDLKELQEILQQHGADIISKPQQGYCLVINDKKEYQNFLRTSKLNDGEQLPSTSRERIQYLLEYLLASDDFIKIDNLCDLLYVSKSSLSHDLKEVRQLLSEYHLTLIQRPNYGIKVKGKEFDLRLCIANTTINRMQGQEATQDQKQKETLQMIASIITDIFQEYHFHISNVSFQNLIVHIYIAILRIRCDSYVYLEDEQLNTMREEDEFQIARHLCEKLEAAFQIQLPESEIGYICIHLASKRMMEANCIESRNVVIDQEINDLISKMLYEVYQAFKIDFRNDLELRMNLALHLIPMKVRMKYDLTMQNPLLKEIKLRFIFAYTIAVAACDVLQKISNKMIAEDEIAYFALHFNLALERRNHNAQKSNILIVCATGRGSAELLVYRFKETFGKQLNRIDTCDVLGLAKYDFHSIDYVITTVAIQTHIPVPILEVSDFLESEDVVAIRQFLYRSNGIMERYFDPNLFLIDIEAQTKEEVLKLMCQAIHRHREVPDSFYHALLKREEQARTEFGNLVAIPHPNCAMSKETFVCVAILAKPIFWDRKKVQFVYMLSIEDSPTKNLQKFYQITSKFLINKELVKEVIKKKDFYTMMRIFQNIECLVDEEEAG